jgi:hypothetical protein
MGAAYQRTAPIGDRRIRPNHIFVPLANTHDIVNRFFAAERQIKQSGANQLTRSLPLQAFKILMMIAPGELNSGIVFLPA